MIHDHVTVDCRGPGKRRSNRWAGCVWLALTMWVAVAAAPRTVAAQDSHYWMNRYGTRAKLLGGVVAGSILDLSDTYYNPGALSLVTDPSLVLGTQTYQIRNITLRDGAGKGIDLSSTQSGFSPGLFAGLFTLDKTKRNRFAYSLLTRHDFDFEVDGRQIDRRDAIPRAAGDEDFAGEVILATKLLEGWGGVTWARKVGDKVGLGVTQYVAVRSRRARFQTIAEAVESGGGDGSALIDVREFKYWNVRTLWKIGAAFDYRPLTFGVTITTPSVNLFGQGSSYVNRASIGVDTSGDSIPDSEMATDYQKDLGTNVESGLSIAVGGSYRFYNTTVHGTVEWFDKVGPYAVLDPQDFRAQTTGEVISPKLIEARESVTNFGVGLAQIFPQDITGFASLTTDFSAASPKGESTLSNWNIYHVQAGSTFKIRSSEFTLGVGYSFGSDEIDQAVDFSNPTQLAGQTSDKKVRFRQLRFTIGFSLGF